MARGPELSPRDLKSIAGTFALSQKIREKASPSERGDAHERLKGTVAGLIIEEHLAAQEADRGVTLGRCRNADELGDGLAGPDESTASTLTR
jgi:hypothetical protein